MSEPEGPTRGERRSPGRRAADQADEPQSNPENLPVVAGKAHDQAKDQTRAEPLLGDAGFTAQVLGEAPRRGLKGGPETLERARATYLGTEYSGGADRRPKKGRITKTEV
jgi:hypothetical protein